jgi:tellurite methyltransferase
MDANRSVRFFDEQFRRQVAAHDFSLNPFEAAALPHLHGTVLDYGCGLGNLAVAACRRGCSVVALDASPAAIEHLRSIAALEGLPLRAEQADLRDFALTEDFDAVVCIGLLMFLDCATASRQLAQLKAHVRPGGLAVVNVLTQGTTFMDMFAADAYCLFGHGELVERFAGWEVMSHESQEFSAARGTKKVFATVIARRPQASATDR